MKRTHTRFGHTPRFGTTQHIMKRTNTYYRFGSCKLVKLNHRICHPTHRARCAHPLAVLSKSE